MKVARLYIWLLLVSAVVFAANPNPSTWMSNLSEPSSDPTQLTKYNDYSPEIVVSGKTVHVLWLTAERPSGGPEMDAVYYKRSVDGGQTWDKKIRLYGLYQLEHNYGYSDKLLAVDGQNVYVAFNIYGQAGPNPPRTTWFGRLAYVHSTDGGQTFSPMQILYDAPDAWNVYHIFVSADSGKLSIGYQTQCNWCVDTSFGVMDSFDNGATFKTRPAFSITGTGHGWDAWDMKRVGNAVYVLYTDAYSYYGLQLSNLYVAAAVDGGNFKSTKISTPSKNGNDKAYNLQVDDYTQKLTGWKSNVHVTWLGLDANDQQQIYAARSTDFGATWEKPVVLTGKLPAGTAYDGNEATIEAKGAFVNVAFTQRVSSSNIKLFTCQSADNGVSFSQPQELTSPGYWKDSGYYPRLALDPSDDTGKRINAFWSGPQVRSSTDGGLMFSPSMWLSPMWSWGGAWRPRVAVGADGGIHWVMEGSFGVGADADIFYRRWDPAPAPSTRGSLRLTTSNTGNLRYDAMEVRPSSDINFTNTMTAEIWVKPLGGGNTNSGGMPIFHKREIYDPNQSSYMMGTMDGNGGRMPMVEITTTQGIFWLTPGAYNNPAGAYFKATLADLHWTHLAFSYDANATGNNFKLYVNGQLVALGAAKGALKTGDGDLFLGYYGSWDVDEFRLWNKVQSASDILALKDIPLSGKETGLAAYWNFDNTTKDITGHGNDGVLLYQESYQPDLSTQVRFVNAYAVRNAASYSDVPFAPESIVTVFGSGFMDSKDPWSATSLPLPTTLNGLQVQVIDFNNQKAFAPLFFANQNQVNLEIPPGMAEGTAQLVVMGPQGFNAVYWFSIQNVAPGLFTANQSGSGSAVGYAILAAASGAQATQAFVDSNLVAQQLNFGNAGDQLYLELFGTGFRKGKTVTCTIGGVSAPVAASAQPQFVGLDQVNIGPVPKTLAGQGQKDIVITMDGNKANTVTLRF